MSKRQTYDNEQFRAMLGRLIVAYGKRGAAGDSTDLEQIAALAGEVAAALEVAVAGQRAGGASWSYVGNALGMSKQAAQQRYGTKAAS